MNTEITAKTWFIRERVFDEATAEEIAEKLIALKQRFLDDMDRREYVLIHEAKTDYDRFHFSYHCKYSGCENNDIDLCIEQHPQHIQSIGPYILLICRGRTIPKQYAEYVELFRQSSGNIIKVPRKKERNK